METIKNTANQISETVQGAGATASKEGNKEIAKGHTNASATTRLAATKDAAHDKMNEKKHETKSDVYANK